MSEVVGSVYVRVRALTDKLNSEIQKGIDKSLKDLDVDAAVDAGDDVGSGILDGASDRLEREGPRVGRRAVRAIEDGAVPEGNGFGRRFSSVFWTSFRNRNSKEEKKNLESISKTVKKFVDGFKGLAIPGRFLLIGLAIPLVSKGIVLIGQYLTVLVGQLGFVAVAAAGAGAAIAGVFGAGLLAFGALKLGFTELSDETKKAFKGVKEDWSDFTKAVSKRVQPAIVPQLVKAAKVLDKLSPAFLDFSEITAKAFGDAVLGISKFLSSEKGLTAWNKIMHGSGEIIKVLGRILGHVGPILIQLFAAVQPIALKFVQSLEKMVAWWRIVIDESSRSGRLESTLNGWWIKAKQLGKALGDLFIGLWNLFTVGADSAQPFMDTFSNFAAMFRVWTTSLEGKNRLKEIFDNARPAVHEFNKLIADIWRLIFAPVRDEQTGMAGFFKTLREDFLPWIKNSFLPEVKKLKQPLLDLAQAFGDLFIEMEKAGTLDKLVKIVSEITKGLTLVLSIPGLGQLLGWLLAIGTALSVIATIFKPLGAVIKLLSSPLVLAAFQALGAAVLSVFGVSLGGSVVAALAEIAVGVAIVIAVVASLYAVWRNWDTIKQWAADAGTAIVNFFKDVKEKWNDFKDNFFDGLERGKRLVGEFVEDVKAGWNALSNVKITIPDFETLFNGFTSGIDTLRDKLPDLNLDKHAGDLVNFILEAIDKAPGLITKFIGAIARGLINLPIKIGTIALKAANSLVNWISEAAPMAAGALGRFLGTLTARIIGLPLILTTLLARAHVALISWILDATSKVNGLIRDFSSAVGRAIIEFVTGLPVLFVNASVALWSWITEAGPQAGIELEKFAVGFGLWALDFATRLPGMVVSFAGKFLSWTANLATELPLKMLSFVLSLGSWILNFVLHDLPRMVADIAQAFWSWATDLAADVGPKLLGFLEALKEFFDTLPGKLAETIAKSAGSLAGNFVDSFKKELGKIPGGGIVLDGLDAINPFDFVVPDFPTRTFAGPASTAMQPFTTSTLFTAPLSHPDAASSGPIRQFNLSPLNSRASITDFARDLARLSATKAALQSEGSTIHIDKIEVVSTGEPHQHATDMIRALRDKYFLTGFKQ